MFFRCHESQLFHGLASAFDISTRYVITLSVCIVIKYIYPICIALSNLLNVFFFFLGTKFVFTILTRRGRIAIVETNN